MEDKEKTFSILCELMMSYIALIFHQFQTASTFTFNYGIAIEAIVSPLKLDN